jgi:hypothetical protein
MLEDAENLPNEPAELKGLVASLASELKSRDILIDVTMNAIQLSKWLRIFRYPSFRWLEVRGMTSTPSPKAKGVGSPSFGNHPWDF